MDMTNCEDCVFWEPDLEDPDEDGLCMRDPPIINPVLAKIDDASANRGYWPLTKAWEGCARGEEAR
jgi:hypothetical protein